MPRKRWMRSSKSTHHEEAGRESLAGVRHGRGEHCRARGACWRRETARSTRTLGVIAIMAALRIDASLILIVLWAVLLSIVLVLGPSPRSVAFWTLIGTAVLTGLVYIGLTRRDARRSQRETAEWLHRLKELVDVHDFEGDGHFSEFLDGSERQRIIEALESMPKGSRSLRRAIHLVSPDVVSNDA